MRQLTVKEHCDCLGQPGIGLVKLEMSERSLGQIGCEAAAIITKLMLATSLLQPFQFAIWLQLL